MLRDPLPYDYENLGYDELAEAEEEIEDDENTFLFVCNFLLNNHIYNTDTDINTNNKQELIFDTFRNMF